MARGLGAIDNKMDKRTTPVRTVVISTLLALFTFACSKTTSRYELVRVAAQGSLDLPTYSWCDNDHLVLRTQKGVDLVNVQTLERQRIKLIDGDGNELTVALPSRSACAGGQIFGGKLSKATEHIDDWRKSVADYYVGPIDGGRAQLLIAPVERMLAVNPLSKYILAQKLRARTTNDYAVIDECAINHHPDYKVLCLDTHVVVGTFFALRHYIVAPYTWDNQILVRADDRSPELMRNKTPPRPNKLGKPIYRAFDVMDLDLALLSTPTDDATFKFDFNSPAFDPDERYFYLPCSKRSESRSESEADFYGVCRYALSTQLGEWQRLFVLSDPQATRGHIENIDVAASGDIYFNIVGARAPNTGVWKFDSMTARVTRITDGINTMGDKNPKVSPDGRQVAFVRSDRSQEIVFIARTKSQ